jgi:hypothetical protein
MTRGNLAAAKVSQLGRRERTVLYRAAAATRGGGESGSEARGSSSCFNCVLDRVAAVGVGTDANAGNTKAIGAKRNRSLGWQQDIVHAVMPLTLWPQSMAASGAADALR